MPHMKEFSMRHSLLLFVVAIGLLFYAPQSPAGATGDNQNELIAAKSALTDAVFSQAEVQARYAAGAVTGTDVGKATLRVDQAKLKLAVLERGGGDVVATMKRIIALEQDQEELMQTRFAAGAVTGLDLKDTQFELAEQQVQLGRANVATLRQQQLELAQQHAKAGVITESDLTRYRTSTECAWEELKSHIPE
jgi:outer membrane protein TolC